MVRPSIVAYNQTVQQCKKEGVCGDNLLRAGRGWVGTTCCAPGGGVWGQLVVRREGVCGENLWRAGRGWLCMFQGM